MNHKDIRIKFFCRSFDLRLYTLSRRLYEGMGFPCVRLTDQTADGYFYTMLKDKECDVAINVDEDCFITDPQAVMDLVDLVLEKGYANAGYPDGGVLGARPQNPLVTNPFFNVFDLKKIREKFSLEAVKSFDYEAHKEEMISKYPKERLEGDNYSFGKVENEEPYYPYLLWLAGNFETLYLPSKKHSDKTTTLLYDLEGRQLCAHTWYARFYTMPDFLVKRVQASAGTQKIRIDKLIREAYHIRGMEFPTYSRMEKMKFALDRMFRWMIKIPQRIMNWPRKIKRKLSGK